MSEDYQCKKNNIYFLPRSLYLRVLALIRDYERARNEINDIIYGTATKDGVAVSGGRTGNPTENKVIRLEKYQNDVDAVENALSEIPEEYQKGIFRNIVYKEKFPETAHRTTWIRWKERYIWCVARELDLV